MKQVVLKEGSNYYLATTNQGSGPDVEFVTSDRKIAEVKAETERMKAAGEFKSNQSLNEFVEWVEEQGSPRDIKLVKKIQDGYHKFCIVMQAIKNNTVVDFVTFIKTNEAMLMAQEDVETLTKPGMPLKKFLTLVKDGKRYLQHATAELIERMSPEEFADFIANLERGQMLIDLDTAGGIN